MVGIFSRFSATKPVALFPHSSPVGKDDAGIARDVGGFPVEHGVEPPEEFTPIEHPMEPLENDQPVRCPQPEPCIIHDGRIWKQRLQQSMQRRREVPFLQETESQGLQQRRHMVHTQHVLSSSSSATGSVLQHDHR